MIQGILVGFGFYLFDVPSPAIWGFVAAISSIIPTIGTSMVTIPGVLFLLFTGHPLPALGLLIWAITAVGLIDNFLAPIIIKSGVNIHPFLILMSVLGGIAVFGPLGFIIGPVLLSLLFTLFDLYPMMFGNNSSSETKKIQ
jgi:predicted PurR-regulated permease PerM